jgi:hypothetical protein
MGLVWLAGALLAAGPVAAQDIGHKIPGGLGVDAGVQVEPGLYVANRLLYYTANMARDRRGERIDARGFDLDALGNAWGVSAAAKVPHGPYLSAAFSAPLARVTLNSDDPLVAIDRFGLGDLFILPLRVGWRVPHVDLVTSYAVYVPTGRFEPGGSGVSSGHVTHQFSLGGAVLLDGRRRWRASALLSYDLNQRKRGIDITRGDTLQIQGGAGGRLLGVVDLGVAGYALWQVCDDRGSALPAVLRGARDRVFGVGPEVGVEVAAIRGRARVRYEWDLAARSRPQGSVLVFDLAFLTWAP